MNQPNEQNYEFARSLSRLVKGLSILFWGIPVALVVCVKTSVKNKFELQAIDFWGPITVTGLLLLSLFYINDFRKSEKVWTDLIDRAKFFGIINFALSPFVYWRLRVADVPSFTVAVWIFFISGTLFLLMVNRLIQQLSRMLPEHSLREDASVYGRFNQIVLRVLAFVLFLSFVIIHWKERFYFFSYQFWRALEVYQTYFSFITVVPVAMTMTLIWKTREVILNGVFSNACRELSGRRQSQIENGIDER
ncbi:MAG: hypothetical protein N2487_01120 [Verrucomicrobiae bacterium]|nr:hypothetical protein [Verrucomicrobiae bacterium]